MKPKFKIGDKVQIRNFGFTDPSLGFCQIVGFQWKKSPENIVQFQIDMFYWNNHKQIRLNEAVNFLFAHPAHLREAQETLLKNKNITKWTRETFTPNMYTRIGSMLVDRKNVIKIEG